MTAPAAVLALLLVADVFGLFACFAFIYVTCANNDSWGISRFV